MLYIVLFLHQTATRISRSRLTSCCISFYSYIKPQQGKMRCHFRIVVYRSIPTSNRNILNVDIYNVMLYIVLFLHQTATQTFVRHCQNCCISFYSYIKPQQSINVLAVVRSCISFYSYIKPQLDLLTNLRPSGCISFYSYIKPQRDTYDINVDSGCISFYSYIKPQLNHR